MALGLAYLLLLLAGIAFFLLHYVSAWWLSRRLRSVHPRQWRIIAMSETGEPVGAVRRWLRLQNALRSPVLPALEDSALARGRQLWRIFPWLAWACLIAAFVLRLIAV